MNRRKYTMNNHYQFEDDIEQDKPKTLYVALWSQGPRDVSQKWVEQAGKHLILKLGYGKGGSAQASGVYAVPQGESESIAFSPEKKLLPYYSVSVGSQQPFVFASQQNGSHNSLEERLGINQLQAGTEELSCAVAMERWVNTFLKENPDVTKVDYTIGLKQMRCAYNTMHYLLKSGALDNHFSEYHSELLVDVEKRLPCLRIGDEQIGPLVGKANRFLFLNKFGLESLQKIKPEEMYTLLETGLHSWYVLREIQAAFVTSASQLDRIGNKVYGFNAGPRCSPLRLRPLLNAGIEGEFDDDNPNRPVVAAKVIRRTGHISEEL